MNETRLDLLGDASFGADAMVSSCLCAPLFVADAALIGPLRESVPGVSNGKK